MTDNETTYAITFGLGLWVGFVFLIGYYFAAHISAKHTRMRERNAEIIRSVVVPSRDAHFAEKRRGE